MRKIAAWVLASLLLLASGDAALGLGVAVESLHASSPRCPYCGKLIRPGAIPEGADRVVEEQLKEELVEKRLPFRSGKDEPTVLHVLLFRFRDRLGRSYSAERPASVGFHLHLLESGRVTRTGVFDEEQRALFENVLGLGSFIRRGGGWVTADELCREGIRKLLPVVLKEGK